MKKMEIILSDSASKITFDDVVDLHMAATFQRLNTFGFDSNVPPTEIRWATIRNEQGFGCLHGCLVEKHDSLNGRYIFIDQRLQGMALFAELVLLHEMCHYLAPSHDQTFVKQLLLALQRVSWEPLVGKCMPCDILGLDE